MPTPTKPAPKPKKSKADVLVLFLQNIEEIARHYRRQASGPEVGSNVMRELTLGDVSLALRLALEDKAWEKGNGIE